MCIQCSVGAGGVNMKSDVRIVQAALNQALSPENPLVVDGLIGPATISVIDAFRVGQWGLIALMDGSTLTVARYVLKAQPKAFSSDCLAAVMPTAPLSKIETFPLCRLPLNEGVFLVLAAWRTFAQIGHESLLHPSWLLDRLGGALGSGQYPTVTVFALKVVG